MKISVIAVALRSLQASYSRTFHRDEHSFWISWSQKDAMTDRTNAEIRLPSIDMKMTIILNCDNSGPRPNLTVSINSRSHISEWTDVTFRYDDGAPESALWETDGTDVFSRDAQRVMAKILKSKRFIARVEDGRIPPNDGRFLPGNGEALAQMVFTACGNTLKL